MFRHSRFKSILGAVIGILCSLGVIFGPSFSNSTLKYPKAQAFWGIGDTVVEVGQNLVTNVKTTVETTLIELKGYVLDGLAYTIAKIALQQLTASVVNWINSGFEGSPAFLTNPEGFFLDTADQITGSFIAQSGALQALCSPISLDVRLALALGQGRGRSQRYTCTLNTIIGNIKGATINGFTAGDFSQGGWTAFVSLSEPQNNVYGAYLEAHSDLLAQIATKNVGVGQDLLMGRGFRSWQKCDNISASLNTGGTVSNEYLTSIGISRDQYNQLNSGGDQNFSANNGTNIRKRYDVNSQSYVYEQCSTQTPGSVIAGTIDKSLGIPADALNLADSINEIVSALFAQLVTQVLTHGLHSVSQGTATNKSYTSKFSDQDAIEKMLGTSAKDISKNIKPFIKVATKSVELRQEAYDLVKDVRVTYESARACFISRVSQGTIEANYGANQISQIEVALGNVGQVELEYKMALDEATQFLTTAQKVQDAADHAKTPEELQNAANTLTDIVRNTSVLSPNGDEQPAVDALKSAKEWVKDHKKDANKYVSACISSTTRTP